MTYIYISFILIAFLSSLVSWRQGVALHFRIFSVLLGLTVVVESFAAFLGRSFHFGPFSRVYTIFLLLQFWVYGYFFYRVVWAAALRRLILVFLVGFPLFWVVTESCFFGFLRWNPFVPIVGSFFTIVFVLLYYYELITDREAPSLQRLPEFWIATGMLLFYLGALPYFGTLDFLVHRHLLAGSGVWVGVIRGLDIFMYALIALGYGAQWRRARW
jgi:hypothetical protein